MFELKLLSVQSLSHQRACDVFRICTNRCEARFKARTVGGIAHYRMADMREMHAYLMCTSGFENQPNERDIAGRCLSRKDLQNLVMGFRLTAILSPRDGNFEAIGAAALKPRVDTAGRLGKPPPDERQVAAMKPPIAPMAFELLR